ncbi:tRNA (adenosine(37)-N6)-dimethylallyltransferase MiaA [bacterium]|nr:tRNA (adenosine(37)-N6)-dimethylallyltransferase MiaA [bacterium]MCG2676864.1 tRNA (adenosine(37)-N6)-dimethylallyltransferase MiaA [bacterium]
MKKSLVVIVGPTAVGKSEVAIELAKKINGEIVSCDSRQVYEHLNIGTAKPTKEERKKIPHHLIDIIKPNEEFNAFLYAQRAHEAISKVHKKKKIPILVGGSGLYVRAVLNGIFPGAGKNKEIRNRLEKFSSSALYKKLKETDPKTALRLHPHDKVRLIRALEVYELTGQPISALQKVSKEKKPNYNLMMVGLKRKREELYQRINKRVEGMIEGGLVEEVRGLLKKGFSKDLIALKGLGYKEIIGYLDREYGLEEAIRLLKRNSRRFAKRQLTWFSQDKRIHWIEIAEKDLANRVASQIANMVEC